MNNVLEQNVPTTTSAGSFGEARTSNTRTYYPYSEKEIPFITPFVNQNASDYLDNISHFKSASVTQSLVDEITVKKPASTFEVGLAFYEKIFALFQKKSSGLTQTTALRKLDELRSLLEDWDSYGAGPISLDAIEKAKSIVTSVMRAFDGIIGNVVQLTDVIPIADGGVQLEWVGPTAELEIEISPNGIIGLLYISLSKGMCNYDESKDNSLNDVYVAIARLIHSQSSN